MQFWSAHEKFIARTISQHPIQKFDGWEFCLKTRLPILFERLQLKDAIKLASPSFLSIPITLLAVPACLSVIGVSAYGLLLIFFLLINQSHMLLFGAEKNLIREILKKSAFLPNLYLLQIITFLYGVLLAFFFIVIVAKLGFFDTTPISASNLYFLAAGIPVHFLWSSQRAILQGTEKFNALGLTTFLYMAATQYMPLAVILVAPDSSKTLTNFLCAVLLARAAITVCIIPLTKINAGTTNSSNYFDVFRLMNYGKWMGFNQMIQIFFDGADRYFIGIFLSPAAVAIYSIPMQVAQKLAAVPIAFSQIVFNKTSASSAKKSENHFLCFSLIAPLISAFYFAVNGPFFKFWLGHHATPIIQELAILTFTAVMFTSFNFVLTSIIEASGNAKQLTKYDSVMFMPLIGLVALLTFQFGVIGASAALILKEIIFFTLRLKILRPSLIFIKISLSTSAFIFASAAFAYYFLFSDLSLALSQILISIFWILTLHANKHLAPSWR